MAMMARAVCCKASLLPCAATFSRTLDNPCSTSSGYVSAGFRAGLGERGQGKGSSLVMRASALSSASSSFRGRLCLVLTCPAGEVREGKRTGVQASLLGVGAPEALVIGVVALLVFGPKGLAEVARTLGKSLRAFQPTIKELQQVSREFKATLEQEIGLDELRNPSTNDSPPMSTPSRPNSVSSAPTSIPTTLSATEAPPAAPKTEEAPAQPKPYTTEDYVRITEEQANALVSEEQRKASEAAAWGGTPPVKPVEVSCEGLRVENSPSSLRSGAWQMGSVSLSQLRCVVAKPGANAQRLGVATRAAAADASSADASSDPLLVRAARKEKVERAPAWMMRQAGRYMANYRKLSEKHPSFRERSENTDLIVEISLQPWKAFRPDGVIIFSDILTPLPAIGIPFEIDETKGPVLETPIESEEGLKALHSIDLNQVNFVGESLSILRNEVGDGAAVLGFIGSPWTLATYIVEGKTTRTYTKIKSMTHLQPKLLDSILSHLANEIAEYVIFQVKAGAQCMQIFDSWGGQLPPHQWDRWSKPYIQQLVAKVRAACPGVPLVMYINGNGGLLERMATVDVDVIGLDWTIDMADGRSRLGDSMAVQGNVDPAVLFAPLPAITEAIESVVSKAGNRGHILNLGHGVLVGTPEEGVAHFFDTARSLTYNSAELATSSVS